MSRVDFSRQGIKLFRKTFMSKLFNEVADGSVNLRCLQLFVIKVYFRSALVRPPRGAYPPKQGCEHVQTQKRGERRGGNRDKNNACFGCSSNSQFSGLYFEPLVLYLSWNA